MKKRQFCLKPDVEYVIESTLGLNSLATHIRSAHHSQLPQFRPESLLPRRPVMSARVDQFCDNLKDRLHTLEDQLAMLRTNVQKLPKQGEQALQKCLADARSKIEAEKKKVEQAQANLKARADKKISQAKDTINQWKAKGELSMLNARADLAEQYAADAVFVAVAALSDAEEAIVDAVIARNDAVEAEKPAAAVR
jgi:hypothetical protein